MQENLNPCKLKMKQEILQKNSLTNPIPKELEEALIKNLSKMNRDLINSIRFDMIYYSKVSDKQEQETIALVKEYRSKKHKSYLKELFA